MIPYYFRITRFEHQPGEFKVSPVSAVNRVGSTPIQNNPTSPTPKTEPHTINQSKIYENAKDQEDFHLLEAQENHYPIVAERGPWTHYFEQNVKSNGTQILVVLEAVSESLNMLLWALLYANWLSSPLKILSAIDIDFEELLTKAIQEYHQKGYKRDLLKSKPVYQKILPEELLQHFLNETRHQATSLAIFSSLNAQHNAPILHGSHCPLLWVPPNTNSFRIKNILVPIEKNSPSLPVIQQALTLCQIFNSSIHLMHVSSDSAHETEETRTLNRLTSLINWQGIRHDNFVSKGEIAQTIVNYASTNQIDLIVMGTHHIKEMNQESRAQNIIQAGNIPVFVVHPYKD